MPKIGVTRIDVDPTQNCLRAPVGNLATRLKRGDRRPALSAQLFDAQGDPQLLVGIVGVVFRMRDPITRRIVVADQPAVIVSPGDGQVRYDWQAGDTDLVGKFEAWFVVEHAAGVFETFPNVESHAVVIDP